MRIDQDGERQIQRAKAAHQSEILINIGPQKPGIMILEESARLVGTATPHIHGNNRKLAFRDGLAQLGQCGQFLDTGRAPAGPEIQQDIAPAKFRQCMTLAIFILKPYLRRSLGRAGQREGGKRCGRACVDMAALYPI